MSILGEISDKLNSILVHYEVKEFLNDGRSLLFPLYSVLVLYCYYLISRQLITSNNNKQNAVELETTIDAITITSEPDQKYFYYVNNFENPLNEMSQGVSSGKSRTEIPLGR